MLRISEQIKASDWGNPFCLQGCFAKHPLVELIRHLRNYSVLVTLSRNCTTLSQKKIYDSTYRQVIGLLLFIKETHFSNICSRNVSVSRSKYWFPFIVRNIGKSKGTVLHMKDM
jgi:hypothetical protein